MEPYPQIYDKENVLDFCKAIARERGNDITDFTNLPNIFMQGRKVQKVPSASNDVAATDRIGDFNYDASYLYLVVDDSGAEWRRVALATW